LNTIAFIRLHRNDQCLKLVIREIGRKVDGLFFLLHDPIDPEMYDTAAAHPKCQDIRCWTKAFSNHNQLQFLTEWAREIRPKYVLEFDEDELPPARFREAFTEFKKSDKNTMWFWGVWAWGNPNTIAVQMMHNFFWHMKAYKYSECIARRERKGFNSFTGIGAKSKDAFLCKYPLRHLAFMTPKLRERRMARGDSKGRKYKGDSWFMQPDIITRPYDTDLTLVEWKQLAKREPRL
jgi:hypothetical protein